MKELIFIYSAKSSLISNVPGAIKKVFGGKSDCSLCNITYGPIFEKGDWTAFLRSRNLCPTYYHCDDIPEYVSSHLNQNEISLPVILEHVEGALQIFISPEELNSCNGKASQLITLFETKT